MEKRKFFVVNLVWCHSMHIGKKLQREGERCDDNDDDYDENVQVDFQIWM